MTDPSELAGGQDQDVALTEAGASGADGRESESNFFNRAIRSVAGLFGARDEASDADAGEPAEAETPTTQAAPKSEAEIREEARREAQSLKDREVRDFRRTWALERAEQGDLDALVELATKYGDAGFAKQELAKHGAVYEAGQVTLRETEEQQAGQQAEEQMTQAANALVPYFDQAVLKPVLDAVPDDATRQALIALTAGSIDGRTQAVTKALDAIRADAADKLLSDEKFVRRMLGREAFRKGLITEPVANKQLRAYFRGELDETDLNPGVGRGGGLERESDVMNAQIRAAAGIADARALTTGGRASRAAPDDDE